jgi:phosphoserine phosphatase RsbU/P
LAGAVRARVLADEQEAAELLERSLRPSALRAYALLGAPPDEVLTLTSRKLNHFEPGAMVTAICATSRPPFDEFLVCSAGHPAPVLAVPGQSPTFIAVPNGPPVGVEPTAGRSSAVVPVPVGGVMVLYSDGLVERRGEILDTGLEHLLASVTTGHPEVVCNAAVERLIGSKPPRDDVAIVAVRRDQE